MERAQWLDFFPASLNKYAKKINNFFTKVTYCSSKWILKWLFKKKHVFMVTGWQVLCIKLLLLNVWRTKILL